MYSQKRTFKNLAIAAAICLSAFGAVQAADAPPMGFFVSSRGSGNGGDLDGLKGADNLCQQLAQAAGAGDRAWAAYLSTQGSGAENARDRIGTGPWYNAKGVLIARNVAELHQPGVNINLETALDERGQTVPYVKVDANGAALPREQQSLIEHDILTGSQADGTAFTGTEDRTCRNWTSSDDGNAMIGHHDRRSARPGLSPWNTAHPTRGCSQQALANTDGAGRLYCFAK